MYYHTNVPYFVYLQGGYNLTSVAESLCSCVCTLLGDSCPMLEPCVASERYNISLRTYLICYSAYMHVVARGEILASCFFVVFCCFALLNSFLITAQFIVYTGPFQGGLYKELPLQILIPNLVSTYSNVDLTTHYTVLLTILVR